MKWIITMGVILLTLSLPFVFAKDDNQSIIDDELKDISSTLLDSSLFTQVDDTKEYIQEDVDMTNFEAVLENELLILYVNNATFSIRIKNKTTGFIWSSNLTHVDEGEFNALWLRKIDSPFFYEYYDDKNTLYEKSMLDSRQQVDLSKTVDKKNNSVAFTVDLKDTQFRFTYHITLNGDELDIVMDRDSIEEYGKNRLRSISFFEFFGAAKKDHIPGYNFIPSGNGALVRYGAHSQINARFRARFYGQDLYFSSSEPNSLLSFPVFGGVHGINQNGYLYTITNGKEFAQYVYEPTGSRANYHRQYPTFILRESYNQYIKGSDSRLVIEKSIKNINIGFTVSILTKDEANYVGMANRYKDYLIEEDKLTKQPFGDVVNLHLEFLGSDYEKGLFLKKHHKMTTVADILEIDKTLTDSGIPSIYYTLRGFNKGGNYDAAYNNYKWNRSLGKVSDLNALDVDYYYNPTVVHTESSKNPRRVLTQIGNTIARRRILDEDYYQYFIDIDTVLKQFPKALKTIEGYGGMALDGLSNQLYSNKRHTRDEMIPIYENLLTQPIPMYQPNDLMLAQTSKYLNTPLNHERLRFFTDNVPFLQIVLSGYIPYYSNFLNFSANSNIDRLKAIDFGVNPAYLVTKEASHLLSKTFSRNYYATYYGNLSNHIVESYEFISGALNNVYGEEIISRHVVEKGLVIVGYSNGMEIIINYNPTKLTYQGITIDAHNYHVRKSVVE